MRVTVRRYTNLLFMTRARRSSSSARGGIWCLATGSPGAAMHAFVPGGEVGRFVVY